MRAGGSCDLEVRIEQTALSRHFSLPLIIGILVRFGFLWRQARSCGTRCLLASPLSSSQLLIRGRHWPKFQKRLLWVPLESRGNFTPAISSSSMGYCGWTASFTGWSLWLGLCNSRFLSVSHKSVPKEEKMASLTTIKRERFSAVSQNSSTLK